MRRTCRRASQTPGCLTEDFGRARVRPWVFSRMCPTGLSWGTWPSSSCSSSSSSSAPTTWAWRSGRWQRGRSWSMSFCCRWAFLKPTFLGQSNQVCRVSDHHLNLSSPEPSPSESSRRCGSNKTGKSRHAPNNSQVYASDSPFNTYNLSNHSNFIICPYLRPC